MHIQAHGFYKNSKSKILEISDLHSLAKRQIKNRFLEMNSHPSKGIEEIKKWGKLQQLWGKNTK